MNSGAQMNVGPRLSYGAILAALASHLFFKRFEPSVLQFVTVFGLLHIPAVLLLIESGETGARSLAFYVIPSEILYLIVLSLSVACYRLLLHPLRRFPGPVLPSLSKWYVSYIARSGKIQQWLEGLHQQYGDIVRFGPNELSFVDPEAITFLHGAKGTTIAKGPWYDGNPGRKADIMISTRDVNIHRFRRRIWDRGFTQSALKTFEPRLVNLVQDLCDQLIKRADQEINLTHWIDYYSFDAMGELSFGDDFGMIRNGRTHEFAAGLGKYMRMLALTAAVPWFKTLYRILPINREVKKVGLSFMKSTADRLQERLKQEKDYNDLTKYLVLPDPKTNISLTREQVGQESIIVVVAGSDTSSVCLTYLFYHLLQDRQKFLKLQTEVDSLWDGDSELDGQKLSPLQAPYMNGAINESLRINPPDPNGNQRRTPKGGYDVNGTVIPEHTQVSIHKWTVQRDERNFSRGTEFTPERWISAEDRVRLKLQNHNSKAFMPFGVGQYACVGKPLALLEMRLFLVVLLKRLNIQLASSFNPTEFEEGIKSNLTLLKGSIPVNVTERLS